MSTHEEQIQAGLEEWTERIWEQYDRGTMKTTYVGLESLRFKLFELMQGRKHVAEGATTQRERRFNEGQAEGLELALRLLTTDTVVLSEDVTQDHRMKEEEA
jgi:hypothetical protein